jgi:protein SCO1/2
LLVVVLGVFMAISMLGNKNQIQQPSPDTHTTQLSTPFNLLDHNGDSISEKSMQGKPVAVFFGFTHCPEICPTTLRRLDHYIRTLAREGLNLAGFFITVDPLRDTPEALKTHLADFQGRITGITGPADEIGSLLKNWNVYAKIIPLEGSDYTVDHTASVYLVDERGILQNVLGYQDAPDEALNKLRRFISREP